MRRPLLLAAATLPLLVPSAASAAVRQVSPTGNGAACTTAAPCSLSTGVGSAAAGDEVVVGPGDYGSTVSPLTDTVQISEAGVDVHAAAGQPRPRIFTTADYGVQVGAAGARIAGLEIVGVRPASNPVGQIAFAMILATTGTPATATAEDLVVRRVGGSGYACFLGGLNARLRGSTCWSDGGATAVGAITALWGPTSAQLRNVTAWTASGIGVQAQSTNGRPVALALTNTIAHGGANDVYVAKSTDPATVTATRSAYDPARVQVAGGATGPVAADNLAAPPQLVSPTTGDLRQLATSPTVDAGVDDAANGTTALGGTARVLGARTDIGADELKPAPTAGATTVDGVTPTGTTARGSATTGRLAGTARFEYGPTSSYGATTAELPLAAGSTDAQQVQSAIAGLTPSTTYHARLVVTTAGGTVQGPDATFTTAPASGGGGDTGGGGTTTTPTTPTTPMPPPAPPVAPRLTQVRSASSVRVGRTLPVRFRLDRAATVSIAVVRLSPGVRRGGRCVVRRPGRRGTRCDRTTTIRTVRRALPAGDGRITLRRSDLGRRAGRYRLVLRATASGRTSAAVTRPLRLRRR